MIVSALLLTYLGFLLLSLSMKRHFSQVWTSEKKPSKTQIIVLRIFGFSILLVTGILCVSLEGMPIGLTLWAGLLTVSALIQTMLLSYRPQWLIRCGVLVFVAALISGV